VTGRGGGGEPQAIAGTMSETGFLVVKMEDSFEGVTIEIR